MKKMLFMFLLLSLALTLVACGEKNAGEQSGEGSSQEEISSEQAGKQDVKPYGIGEAAEINGNSITIDKVEKVDDLSIFTKVKEGFVYIKVYVTVKNISTEATVAKNSLLSLVREGGYDPDISDYSRNLDVIGYLADGIYMEDVLNPGESISGWLTYQLKPDEKEITMKYDVIYDDILFSFTLE